MAKVYLALVRGPARFNKLVVVKQIQASLAEDPDFVNMFLDEARLAARLNHPNVVQTNEVGADESGYFIAMEYLEGQTLNRIINRLGPKLSLAMGLRIVSEALSGLHYAHELRDFDGTPLSVVHRDVSPHNIFVTYSGQVKVVDFGIAKALNSSTETRSGVLKGKVAYMSPEQAATAACDRRADVFSVGVILWQLAAGQRMHRGVADIAVIKRLLDHDIPKITDASPNIDPKLAAIIDKALAPKREDRYATAADMQADVDAYVETLEDRRGCREVGKITTETFFEDRHKIQQIVEQEMRRDTERDVGDLPFLEIGPMSETSDSKARRGGTGVTGSLSFGSLSRKESQPGETSTIPSVSVRDSSSLPPPKKPVVPILIGALGLGVLAGIAFVVLRTPKATSEATASPATSAASLTLRIESTPPGATVREGERVLGETPLTVSNPSGGPARDFTLLLGGHDPYTLHASSVTTDLTLMANLKESVGGSAGSAAVAEPVDPPESGSGKPAGSSAPHGRGPGRRNPPPSTAKSSAPAPPPPTTSDIRLKR